MHHEWHLIFKQTQHQGDIFYEHLFKIEWCQRCGMVKTFPHSEHGSYGYSIFYSVGITTCIESHDEPPCKIL